MVVVVVADVIGVDEAAHSSITNASGLEIEEEQEKQLKWKMSVLLLSFPPFFVALVVEKVYIKVYALSKPFEMP